MTTEKEKQLQEEVGSLRDREKVLLDGVKELQHLANKILENWKNK